jgi:mobilome CxxCx(11)CxxC protein
MRTSDSDRVCAESGRLAIHAWGTAVIFQKRSRYYRGLIRGLTYVGIGVPVFVGGLVSGFGLQASFLPRMLWMAAAVGVFQLGFSTWSLVFGWTDNLEYSLESATENFDISSRFKELGSQGANPPADVATTFAIIKAKDDARRAADSKKSITEKELRYGHRAALRQFGRECAACHKIPTSMESSDCPRL